ncbi:manganese transporter [Kangiella profundi]|uniref:Manganese transporter n=1 Tax=Kangiella profundi TaxID=1561924 RepID=A0A2K9A5Z8_9GAMM|nr:Nramp family divalent metal transporter [Kangiella profundi]AUD78170.1 manganese transporter [Kangiella profundi]GGF05693.1 manganese transporter [Kangiella profundi]
MTKRKFSFGPATLVTAAFIGPGTVTVATKAGASFGFVLLWALVFSVIATMILQEMTARLGVVGRKGLGESIREQFTNPLARGVAVILIISAIVIGNAAYEGGNIAGATLGIDAVFGEWFLAGTLNGWALLIGIIAFVLLWTGSYKLIERFLIAIVLVMSVSFILTFIITKPDFGELFSGLLIPTLPDGATLTVIALIGTTVVPYNLFLHASSAKKKWHDENDLPEARRDLLISIPLGGLITMAIISTAASAFFSKQIEINSAADMALSLEPLFGASAKYLIALGLFSAGITSAITAPLASAYALAGLMQLGNDMRYIKFRAVWIGILVTGVILASIGFKPISIIWFAQIANGILLPVIAIFLLWTMNQSFLGKHKNSITQNILGGLVVLVTLMLSGRSLM